MVRVPGREPYRVRLHPHGVPGPAGGPAGAVRRSTRFRSSSSGQALPLPGCRESLELRDCRAGHAGPLGCTYSWRAAGASLRIGCAVSSAPRIWPQLGRVSSCGIAPSSRRAIQIFGSGCLITSAFPQCVRVVIAATAEAADVAEALDLAWWVFRRAAGDDAGWDMAAATAEVRPW